MNDSSAYCPCEAAGPLTDCRLIEPLEVFVAQSSAAMKWPPAWVWSLVQAAEEAFGLRNVPKPAQHD